MMRCLLFKIVMIMGGAFRVKFYPAIWAFKITGLIFCYGHLRTAHTT